jgi:hypothetical protein
MTSSYRIAMAAWSVSHRSLKSWCFCGASRRAAITLAIDVPAANPGDAANLLAMTWLSCDFRPRRPKLMPRKPTKMSADADEPKEPDMTDVSTFEDIAMPADTVWSVIGDFAGI